MSIIDHYESVLGPYVAKADWAVEQHPKFEVLAFEERPELGGKTYASFGISKHALVSAVSGISMRQEFLMTVAEVPAGDSVGLLIAQVGREVLDSHSAALKGSVIGPRGPLFPGTQMEALYVTTPGYLPEGFETFRGPQRDTFVAWLLPITHSEAHFVLRYGSCPFEDILAEGRVELTDIYRGGLI